MQQVDGPGLSLGAWGGGSLPSDRAFLSGRPLVLLRLDTRAFVYVGEGGGDRPQPGLSPAPSLPDTLSKPSSKMGKRTQSGGSERGSREGVCLGGQDLNRPHLSPFHLDHLISIFPTHFFSGMFHLPCFSYESQLSTETPKMPQLLLLPQSLPASSGPPWAISPLNWIPRTTHTTTHSLGTGLFTCVCFVFPTVLYIV